MLINNYKIHPAFLKLTGCLFFLFLGYSASAVTKDTTANPAVTVFSNGYLYPGDSEGQGGIITEGGLQNWTSQQVYTRIFFTPCKREI